MHRRRRALAVLLAALLSLSLVPLFGTGSSGTARAQTGTTSCQYPFDNCPTTSTAPPTTQPQNTTTTKGHGKPTTTTTPGQTTTTKRHGKPTTTTTPANTTTTAQGNRPILVLILDLSSAVPGTE